MFIKGDNDRYTYRYRWSCKGR